MQYLGKAKVPALGLGTWQLKGAQCLTAVTEGLAMGYRHLDTAQMYANQAEVGQAIRNSKIDREKIFLTTKVWRDKLGKADFLPSVDASLRQLQLDYVDLLLIHWPNPGIPLEESLDGLLAAQTSGKAKHIGVSNFDPDLLTQAIKYTGGKLITNQVEYHPFLNQDDLLQTCADNNLFLTAYCPLARGLVTDNAVIHKIAAERGKTAAQITLRWLVQQGVCAIPKSSHPERLKQNLDIFDFELSDTEMTDISFLRGNKRVVMMSVISKAISAADSVRKFWK